MKLQDPKLCPECNKTKPRSEYAPRKNHGNNGIQNICKPCVKIRNKKYYEANREKSIAYAAAWKLANPEWAKKQQTDWKAKNWDRKKELDHRRRTRKQNNGVFVISPKDMKKLSGPCAYCGSTDKITMDHVIPISRGGTHGIGNLVPCCNKCNTVKNARTLTEWRFRKAGRRS